VTKPLPAEYEGLAAPVGAKERPEDGTKIDGPVDGK